MKTISITLVLAIVAGAIIAGVISSERDKDRAQELALAEKRAVEAFELKQAAEAERSAARVDETAEALAQMIPKDPVKVNMSQLVIVRGVVIEAIGDALIVECLPDPMNEGAQWNLGPSAGAAGIAAMAKWAIEGRERNIEKEFGKVEVMSPGVMKPAEMKHRERPLGRFALAGYPQRVDRLNVVAAATGENFNGLPIYTVKFSLTGSVASSPAVVSPFPPGIDTPEQRRHYLQQLAAAKKSATPAPRRLVRDRGY